MQRITAARACQGAIKKIGQPIITFYDLERVLDRMYVHRAWGGFALSVRKPLPSISDVHRIMARLGGGRHIAPDQDFGSGAFRVRGIPDGSPEELCCIVDPFCYISHLSAMQWHGMTDRHPDALHLTTPAPAEWKRLAKLKFEAEAVPLRVAETKGRHARFPQYKFPDHVRGRKIARHQKVFVWNPISLRSPLARISSIPQTLVDAISDPHICGGMSHVRDVWGEYANECIDEIISYIDGMEKPILKVRAGYVLDEVLGVRDVRVDGWAKFACRGGSRVLDPALPWAPRWSEKWMISLNC